MGASCCAAKTDITTQQKTGIGKSGPVGITSPRADGNAAKSKFISSITHIAQSVFQNDQKHEILVLTVPKANFGDFVKELQAILMAIKQQTDQLMIPICLSHSPINPAKDFIVVFRTHENVQSLSLDGWFTTNIVQLSKKFICKSISTKGQKPSDVKAQLIKDLKQWYKSESLNLIGGFQDDKHNLQLLFFKQDMKQSVDIDLLVEEHITNSTGSGDKEIEQLINETHLETNGILRCCISLGADTRTHLFVFQILPGDKMYMILKFPETLQSLLGEYKSKQKLTAAQEGDYSQKFDELLTKWINVQEHKLGNTNAIATLVVNGDFKGSYIVTAP